MGSLASSSNGACEIVELSENVVDSGKKYSIEDEINRLFQAIEVRSFGLERKRAMKRPMRGVGFSPSSGIGISEPVSLKQALRGLCISQASEIASMKRLSKPIGSSSSSSSAGLSKPGNIKRLYRAVVVEASGSVVPMNRGKGDFVEISLVPEKILDSCVGQSKERESVESCIGNPRRFVFGSKKNSVETKVKRGKGNLVEISLVSTESRKVTQDRIDPKVNPKPILKEKGMFSQSSKSSCTSTSEESSVSGSRPHMARDSRWEAIRSVQEQRGTQLDLSHFKLIKRLGGGDIGTVYLAELSGTGFVFALKVMDNESLSNRNKVARAQTEREILEMLDHPFLPTLFAHFVSDKLSCLVMEYCPGGDLHVLRQKQPLRCFSEQAARFYVAEVLVALEYLHMLGVVYRDLKPENILVREDGHIMLSDFDLSLRAVSANPTVLDPPSPTLGAKPSCIEPFCLNQTWHVSCFTPKISTKTLLAAQVIPQLVVEPTTARSNSFVGTHEYLAPEIIKGDGHGSAVDWWTLGVFLFELLYGRTPFKGTGNEDTLSNVVTKSLKFPDTPMVSFHARDLIRGLLIKDPESRFGSVKGATEIKQHSFFDGLNWALIRCTVPPELPKFSNLETSVSQKQESTKYSELRAATELNVFEVF